MTDRAESTMQRSITDASSAFIHDVMDHAKHTWSLMKQGNANIADIAPYSHSDIQLGACPADYGSCPTSPGWHKMKAVILNMIGKQMSDLDPHRISRADNPDGCADCVGTLLKRTYNIPNVGDNLRVTGLETTLKHHGFYRVPKNDRQAGDVIIAYRDYPDGHAGIVVGDQMGSTLGSAGKKLVFDNDSLSSKGNPLDKGNHGVIVLNDESKFFNSGEFYGKKLHLNQDEVKPYIYHDVRIYRAPERLPSN